MRALLFVVMAWSVAHVAACSRPNPVVCCTSPADCNSLGVSDTTRPCSDGFACIDHECTTAPLPDAAKPPCTEDTDCPSSAPKCSPTNTCVECLSSNDCSGNTPVCDTPTNTCEGCKADADCASDACDDATGSCLAETAVLYASANGPDSGACTHAAPCSLSFAVQSVTATRNTVRMIPGAYSIAPVISGTRVTIDGTGSSLNIAVADGGIEVQNGANLTLKGLAITSGNGEGIRCEGGTGNVVSVSHITVDAKGFAILANPCAVTAESSSFRTRNSNLAVLIASPPATMSASRCVFQGGDGVQAVGAGAFLKIDNSLFIDQLGPDGAANGIQFGSSGFGSVAVTFSTFVNSHLHCVDGVPACAGGGTSGACVDNSIIVGSSGDTVTGTACVTNYSIVTPQSSTLGGSHNMVNVDPGFINAQSNYALKSTSPAVDAADPAANAPSPDLAGVSRPQGPRADMGAYEYKP